MILFDNPGNRVERTVLALERPSRVAVDSIVDICSDSDDDDCILLEPDYEEESIVIQDHVLHAVLAPEKPLKVNYNDSDCILLDLEDTKKRVPETHEIWNFSRR
jgi:hypothetical protein